MGTPQFPITWTNAADPAGQATREFAIRRDGARSVTGAVWTPNKRATGLVLCGHGASGNRYQRPIPQLAQRFIDANYAVLSIDGPVHGLRQVGPGGRVAFAEELKRPTCIDDMIADWLLAIDGVRTLDEVGDGPTAYFGLSMGSMFGIPLLARLNNVKVATLGLLGTSGPSKPLRERFIADANAIACPVLYLMQLEDELFPRPGYLELFDALASKDKRLHANPGLHPEVPQEEIDFAFDFMCAHLEGRATRRIIDPLSQ